MRPTRTRSFNLTLPIIHRSRFVWQLLFVTALLLPLISWHQSLPAAKAWQESETLILLNAGAVDTTREPAKLINDDEKRLRLVQFHGAIKSEWYQALLAAGIEVVNYIPNNAYLIYGDSDALDDLQAWNQQSKAMQWLGDYVPQMKLSPSAATAAISTDEKENLFGIQLFADTETNQATLGVINQLQLAPVKHQFRVAKFINVIVALPQSAVAQVAERADVVSITRYAVPRRLDERQAQILAGNLAGAQAEAGDYLAYLAAQGFTQSQFTASSFAINISDSGIDNGTAAPTHFGLYTGGDLGSASRVVYNRLVGSPSGAGSTLQGCDGHGTINAHILSGFVPTTAPFNLFPHADALGFRYGLGIAPFVKVGSSVIFDNSGNFLGDYTYPDFTELESRAYQDNARISSNSWGGHTNGEYNFDAQSYDYLARDAQADMAAFPAPGNQQMVLVFAAGNSGPTTATVAAPGTGKNVITAGASESVRALGGADKCTTADSEADSANDITIFSSRGPTADGRHKPDLVAPGTHVTGGVFQIPNPPATGQAAVCFDGAAVCGGPPSSPNFVPPGQQFYTASSGTSHSTPAIAGAAALVRQRFINESLAPPSPAMTKAALVNSARYLTGADANDTLWSNSQGMGAVNLNSFFDLFGTPTLLRDQEATDLFTATGQVRTFNGTISDPTKPFRVTLAWTDAPGATMSAAWVNNLDLEVTVGGQTYKGNVFSGAFSAPVSGGGGTADFRNNLESVLLPAGTSGAFSVRVTATNIAGDGVPGNATPLDQDFALVVFNIAEALQPLVDAGGSAIAAENCLPGNGVVDPGEVVTVNFTLKNVGRAATNNLTATLLSSGGVINLSTPQMYGAIPAHGGTVSRPFRFRALGACGGAITATLQLQDGATSLGTVNFSMPLGLAIIETHTFTNAAAFTIPSFGASSLYPSTINVADMGGAISKVTVTINGISHTNPDDFDILLVAPTGQKILLMSDCGGGGDLNGVNLTFDDSAPVGLSNTQQIVSGTFKPTNFGDSDVLSSPAPPGPYPDPQQLSAFNGGTPNGAWGLYVYDDLSSNSGQIAGGWSLTLTTVAPQCCASAPCATITLDPATMPAGTAGAAYSQTLTQLGGVSPVTFSVNGALPNGITLSPEGLLAGVPTQTGSFPISILVTDANGCVGAGTYSLTINCAAITLSQAALPSGTVGAAYSQTFVAAPAGGSYSYTLTAGALPPGLSLNNATGVVSGAPTQAGGFNFTITATGVGNCAGSQTYSISVNPSPTGLLFYPLPRPVRLMDTRPNQGNCDSLSTPIAAGTSLTTLARTTCEGIVIPAAAQAVVGNLTAINQGTQSGYLTIYPDGQTVPLASNMIYTSGQIIANNFTVALSSDGKFNVFGERTIDVVIDISGYYAPPGAGGLYYHPLSKPIRLLDTRANQGNCDSVSVPIAAGTSITTLARTTCEGLTIPAVAQAIVANATVVNVSGQLGYMTIYPNGMSVPLASNIIYYPGRILSNAFTVSLNANGEFNIFAERAIDAIVDVAGYYSAEATDAGGPGLLFTPLARPVRILDTRANQGNCDSVGTPITGGTSIAAPAWLTCESLTLPNTAKSVLGNATVINQSSQAGYLTLYPDGVATPLISNMVYFPNQLLANAFVVGTNTSNGQFRLFAERTLDAVVDVSGYFAP